MTFDAARALSARQQDQCRVIDLSREAQVLAAAASVLHKDLNESASGSSAPCYILVQPVNGTVQAAMGA
jgi:hypothetical protein